MLNALLAAASVALVLLFSEYLWHRKHIRSESARKFVHIAAGTVIASFPFWVSYNWIILLSLGFLAINILNRYTAVFHAIHAVKRRTWGDIFFSLGILICALAQPEPWVFTAAVLHLALADGFAAVFGIKFGWRYYHVFDHRKSVVGSLVFAAVSCLIIMLAANVDGLQLSYHPLFLYVGVPLLLSAIENISGYGTDNITVPMAVLVVLS